MHSSTPDVDGRHLTIHIDAVEAAPVLFADRPQQPRGDGSQCARNYGTARNPRHGHRHHNIPARYAYSPL